MNKVTKVGIVWSAVITSLALAGCASNNTADSAASTGNSSSTLAGSNVSPSNPGRVAPQGPRGAGR